MWNNFEKTEKVPFVKADRFSSSFNDTDAGQETETNSVEHNSINLQVKPKLTNSIEYDQHVYVLQTLFRRFNDICSLRTVSN